MITNLNISEQALSLTEDQFTVLEDIKEEYQSGMAILNTLVGPRVTIYGGSLVSNSEDAYISIKNTTETLARKGWGVVSGGGPGIMTAALDGARKGGGKAIAFCINIPGEPQLSHPDVTITFSQFSVRKYLLRQSDAFIFAPGGIGTLDELMEILTLIKTHKHPIKPIFLFDSAFWNGYMEWFKKILVLERHVVYTNIFDLFIIVDTPKEIVDRLTYEK